MSRSHNQARYFIRDVEPTGGEITEAILGAVRDAEKVVPRPKIANVSYVAATDDWPAKLNIVITSGE